jgi:lysophospholipase L1-like esterase
MSRIVELVKRAVSWPAVLVVAAVVAVTVFSAYLLSAWPPAPPQPVIAQPSPGATSPTESEPAPAEEDVAILLSVLGDSYTAPSEASSGPEWPRLLADSLAWEVHTDAVDGSGYMNPGAGGAFGARLDAVLEPSPDVIVVAGGVADLGGHLVPRIAEEAAALVERLVEQSPESEIVLVSPFSNGPPGPLTTRLSNRLSKIARDNDVTYVDATGWLASGGDLFAPDDVHPTDQGQQQIATQMEAALKQCGLAS